jgi:hypothetical protein
LSKSKICAGLRKFVSINEDEVEPLLLAFGRFFCVRPLPFEVPCS